MNQIAVLRESAIERLMRRTAISAVVALSVVGPAQAGIVIPNKPLQSGASVPPNVVLALDTSGSMGYRSLPNYDISLGGGGLSTTDDGDTIPIGGPDGTRELSNTTNVYDFDSDNIPDVSFRTYTYNTLSYNPNVIYQPWMQASGAPMASTPYSAVWTDGSHVGGATGTTSLYGYTPYFLVPKAGATNLNDVTQYYRYQFTNSGSLVRSERDEVNSTTTVLYTQNGLSATRNNWTNGGGTGVTAPANVASGRSAAFTLPASVASLTVRLTGGDADANLYLRFGALPTTGTYTQRASGSSSNETITIANPAAGNWYVGVRAANNANSNTFSNVTLRVEYTTGDPETGVASVGCATTTSGWGWRHCSYATPTGRSEADERQNYANWWSFHRTRMKAAKAGASRAFSELGGDFRVGMAGLGSIPFRIPVDSDGGLFRDRTSPVTSNRTNWFNSLFSMDDNGGTPLRSALQRLGNYYSESGAGNPYKGTGVSELACRQNFAILTTDGYWNGDGGFTGMSGDEDAGTTITGPNSASYTYSPVRPYLAAAENTLADVAMNFWKKDLRTTLDNEVPTSNADPAFWQHMVTFGISLGLRGDLEDSDLPALEAGTLNWPDPGSSDPAKIDDLWHAAVNGRGKFVAATNPQAFAQALRSALSAVVERTASNSNLSANSATLGTDTLLFQARFTSNRWVGEVDAYDVTDTGAALTPAWSASEHIPAPGSRTLLTWDGTAGADFPTTAQASYLNAVDAGVTDYLRGDQSQEIAHGGSFRDRSHLLGDIVLSSPFFSVDSNTIFVGANDGMLHAFSGATGEEQFAYVPGGVDLAALRSLSSDSYAHAYFVDGPVFVAERASNADDKAYLVGALGRGGKGVFGLDVTDPTNIDASHVLWDFNPTAHDLMGNVLGRPFIAKANDGSTAVFVANGPNSTNDKAVLYVLNMTNGAVIAEIDTGVGSAAAPNGLSAPIGWDSDGDDDVDTVYAGDLLGNLWRFDVSSTSPSNWLTAASRKILHSAKDSAGNAQPITGAPEIGISPVDGNAWVFFGTGRLLNSDDLYNVDGTANTKVQTWYGIKDELTTIGARAANLQQRNIVSIGAVDGNVVRGFEPNADLPAGKRAGSSIWWNRPWQPSWVSASSPIRC
ncbi:MAG: pre-peptidase C-terminal domain-containing protein [Xanthomonadales bacterium]|nr:pre-peptidase C-terminal domain-containing protein [Xanthomonadales bacterium]